jgi:hypothetical protein
MLRVLPDRIPFAVTKSLQIAPLVRGAMRMKPDGCEFGRARVKNVNFSNKDAWRAR